MKDLNKLSADITNLQTGNGAEIGNTLRDNFVFLEVGRPFMEIEALLSGRPGGIIEDFHRLLTIAYKLGHRDARHAAAELVLLPEDPS